MELPGDNGGYFDTSERINSKKNTWRGVQGTRYIWHGEWSDAEILYNGEELNSSELEDYMWEEYKIECEENGKTPSEKEYDNLPSQWFKEKLDDYMFYISY